MALMDNAQFLISHIRNSYITSDDTGMCEMIIESEETDKQQVDKRPISWHAHSAQLDSSFSDSGFEHSDSELSHSYDIFPDMDYGAHRRRSNTAQRLERMKKEKRSQVKVKQICWKESNPEFNASEMGHLFEKVTLPSVSDVSDTEDTPPKKSLLSDQLENFSSTSDNPFMEYAKYDGRANLGAGVKKIDIFLTMAPPRDRPYPMTVVVLSTAKVHDLVGLICWQYTSEGREPKLFENVDRYCLHIAEDDGEVDMDFPSLDNREPASKFGFGKLALVAKTPPPRSPNASLHVVTITIPNRGFSKIQVENLNIPLKELMEKVLKKRKIKVRPGMSYNFEKQSEPGVPLDLESLLSSINTLDLCLVRLHSSRGDAEVTAPSDTSTVALSSHQYKSFIVETLNKFRTNTEVQLGISGEKVEIDPVARKGAGRIFKQRAVTYDAEMLAGCEKLEEKSTGKCAFRMIYSTGHEYKHQDFEADLEVAEEIIEKMNNILELRLSTVRKEYLASKKRHLKKRESFR